MNRNDFSKWTISSKLGYLRIYWQKTIFSKCSPFSRKVDIFGYMDNKRLFQTNLKKCALSRKVDIYRDVDKKRFNQNDLKTTTFSSKCFYIRIYEQKRFFKMNSFLEMLIFTNLLTKNDIFKMFSFLSKCWYFRIYGQKTIFSK